MYFVSSVRRFYVSPRLYWLKAFNGFLPIDLSASHPLIRY